VPQNVIKVKLGEEITEIDITGSKRVLDVKTKYAEAKGLSVGRMKFIAGGKVLADDSNVIPGLVIQVLLAPEGGFIRLSSLKQSRKNR